MLTANSRSMPWEISPAFDRTSPQGRENGGENDADDEAHAGVAGQAVVVAVRPCQIRGDLRLPRARELGRK
jgi:hypothetical protein